MVASEPSRQPLLVNALHILALFGLAVAQPLFSTLSESPEFFVAHRVGQLEIIAITAVISLGIPLVIICIEALLRWISPRLQHLFHIAVVCTLLLAIAMQMVNRIYIQSVPLLLTLAFALAVGATALYVRSALMQRAITFLSLGAALFPLNFMFVSSVSKIVLGGETEVEGVDASRASIPVVMVVFDEFNPTVLLDREDNIDAVRYPNFADFANQSWWFSRATSVHPFTHFAVPAILTGLRPDEKKSIPSGRDHPRNLFTLLGSNYSMNVSETLTSLCPDSICNEEEKKFDYKIFASDIIVVVGHILAPRSLADRFLPPLDVGWGGFAAPAEAGTDSTANKLKSLGEQAYLSRPATFRKFISKAGAGKQHLDFIHLPLPHRPYEFFPTGVNYTGGNDIGLRGEVWPDDQNLVSLAYQRYMMQVGLADTLLGELISHLRSVDAYDRSLIIVTADHGRAFQPNTNSRGLTGDNSYILHVPLFVKLPQQTQGRTNPRVVSTIDILPTISEVLGITTSWSFDGKSMFSEEDENTSINIIFNGNNFSLDADEITNHPLLQWQIETFGSNTPLANIAIPGEYSSLIGSDIFSLDISNSTDTDAPFLDANVLAFDNVSEDLGYLPSLLQGGITGKIHSQWVAIAMNNRIVSLAPLYIAEDGISNIAVLLPESAFRSGNNTLSAFFVEGPPAEPQLTSIRTNRETYKLNRLGDTEEVISSRGDVYSVVQDTVFGRVDSVFVESKIIKLGGWSADTTHMKPVKSIIAFVNGEFACATKPTISRPDVAEYFNNTDVESSGFSVVCPIEGEQFESLRVFGISNTGEVRTLGLTTTVHYGSDAP